MGSFWGIIFGLILICFGVGAILGINLWKYFFPVLLILFGLSILFNQIGSDSRTSGWRSSWNNRMSTTQTHENSLNYSFVFNGADKKVITNSFTGGKISAVFGGANIDLSSAKIAKNGTANLEVNAVFGGTKIIVPKTWAVQGNLTGVFGGFDNKVVQPQKPEGTLFIKGSAVFGGGEITN